MLTFSAFKGINNAQPTERLGENELATATNVDIGLSGEISRRDGYTEVSALCHKNLHQADGFMLATCNGDLVKSDGATQTVLQASLGSDRVWYCNLPGGRTAFSNGLICGITDGITTTKWGVPTPESLGALTEVAGDLFPGDYRYSLTYVRLADGLEGAPAHAEPVALADGGLVLTGLPELAGHKINVYLTGADGVQAYFAGSTNNAAFSFTGKNTQLVLPCRTEMLEPAPAGTVTALWRGRVLVAVGPVLYASMPHRHEHFMRSRDFKQFSAPITLVQPVEGGIWVGTEKELAFLAGTEFDGLVFRSAMPGAVVLGSGVRVPMGQLVRGDATNSADAMVCIADGVLVAGYADGASARLTEGRYATAVTEVAATFRMVDRIPQYIAVPQ